jgi:fatty-acyl-CoA synthase
MGAVQAEFFCKDKWREDEARYPAHQPYRPADAAEKLIDCSLGELLRQVAGEMLDLIALPQRVGDAAQRRAWTYVALLGGPEQIAQIFLGSSQRRDRIAVCAPNCPEWVFLHLD